jgi:hypothetical protein
MRRVSILLIWKILMPVQAAQIAAWFVPMVLLPFTGRDANRLKTNREEGGIVEPVLPDPYSEILHLNPHVPFMLICLPDVEGFIKKHTSDK